MSLKKTIQTYTLQSYSTPDSCMEERSAYQFDRHLISNTLKRWVGQRRYNVVVDIGCSTGFLTHHFKDFAHRVIGVDSNERALQRAAERGIETIVDVLPKLENLGPEMADMIISTDTFYYIPNDHLGEMVERVVEVLSPGGILVFNDNQRGEELAAKFSGKLKLVEILTTDQFLKPRPNFERLYWILESKFHICRGLFLALKDPSFDVSRDLSDIRDRKMIQICLRHRWLEHCLWILWPARAMLKFFWKNEFLLKKLCVTRGEKKVLWVFQKI